MTRTASIDTGSDDFDELQCDVFCDSVAFATRGTLEFSGDRVTGDLRWVVPIRTTFRGVYLPLDGIAIGYSRQGTNVGEVSFVTLP
jgi:hypothetical protein